MAHSPGWPVVSCPLLPFQEAVWAFSLPKVYVPSVSIPKEKKLAAFTSKKDLTLEIGTVSLFSCTTD